MARQLNQTHSLRSKQCQQEIPLDKQLASWKVSNPQPVPSQHHRIRMEDGQEGQATLVDPMILHMIELKQVDPIEGSSMNNSNNLQIKMI